jgi:hypothetical protein
MDACRAIVYHRPFFVRPLIYFITALILTRISCASIAIDEGSSTGVRQASSRADASRRAADHSAETKRM